MADGVLRGAGAMRDFMIATFTDLVLRVALSFILAGLMKDTTGIWLSWPIGWTVAAACSVAFYMSGRWKNAGVIRRESKALASELE